ncbi:MAG: DUF4328 domain-containing protein [Patescibacteria group bacterium]|nr:DUF4328 domain-containing protein [candidate division Zixibacteria bacterium]MEA3344230.1 DUF4328 domain-containing protein [Patescibacteria group bacterium]
MSSTELNELAKRYQSMSTEHLVKAATIDRKDYQQEALELIDRELAARELSLEQQKEVQTRMEQNQKEISEIEGASEERVYRYVTDPTSLTKFLKSMLWISLGISVLSLLSDFMQMNLLSSGTFSKAAAEANDSRQQIMGILYLVAFIVTGISFLKWIHRANSNCHGFGAQGMEFTPGWSIGYYFIPFINLYKPYRAMKEIWKVSTNPTNWQNENGSALLGWWWALWLTSNFLGQAVFRLSMRADSISSLQASTTVSIISEIIDIPLYIVAVSLISSVFTKQDNLVRNVEVIYKNAKEAQKKHREINYISDLNVSLDKKLDNIISQLENGSK